MTYYSLSPVVRTAPIGTGKYSVAKGDLNTIMPWFQSGRVSGVNIADAPFDIVAGGGDYEGQPVPLGSGETLTVVSSSNDDLFGGGNGMTSVQVVGLDENMQWQEENFIIAGIAPLAGTLLWKRVFYAYAFSVGSGGANVGTISITGTTSTNSYAVIEPGMNASAIGALTAPVDQKIYINSIRVDVALVAGGAIKSEVAIVTRDLIRPYVNEFPGIVTNDKPFILEFSEPIVVDERCDIKVRVLSQTADGAVYTCHIDSVFIG